MTDERSFDSMLDSEFPNGRCGKCGMGVMTMDGRKACPNCSSKTTTRSGLVNTGIDPGDEGFKRAMSMPIVNKVVPQVTVAPLTATKPSHSQVAQWFDHEANLTEVYNYLCTIPVDSVAQFKQLLKLKKNVLDLSSKIKIFLDSK